MQPHFQLSFSTSATKPSHTSHRQLLLISIWSGFTWNGQLSREQISLCNNKISLFMFFDVIEQSSNSKLINHIKFGSQSPSISSSQISGIPSRSISHLNWFSLPFSLASIHISFFEATIVDVVSNDMFQSREIVFLGK